MTIKGFIQSAELVEDPTDENQVRMIARVQGVSPGQPRRISISFELLLEHEEIDPDTIVGRSFLGDYSAVDQGMAVMETIEIGPARILRKPE